MKINVAELLKGCPKGTELDCAMYDNVTLISIDNIEGTIFPIKVRRKDGIHITLTKYGQLANADYAKCVIFPKGKTTWEGFVPPCNFKDGDVIYVRERLSKWVSIFKEDTGDGIATYADYCLSNRRFYGINDDSMVLCQNNRIYEKRFATEEEKQKLFDAIKDNGYRWDAENKTLEELIKPKFKVGDKVRHKNNHNVVFTVTSIEEDSYGCGIATAFWFDNQDDYELAPDKFDITTLKPFESRVLVRSESCKLWKPTIFGCCVEGAHSPYYALGGTCWKYCIPYEGNEHLSGTTDDCDAYYKTWE